METTKDLKKLETKLKIHFQSKKLLQKSLVHSSFAAENPKAAPESNERLEFLGDAVLEIVVSEFLFHKFPKEREGHLTNWRSMLVNTRQLAAVAKDLELDGYILLSRGEAKTEGFLKESILANVCEALIGAFYLDQGYGAAENFIKRILLSRSSQVLSKSKEYNYKGIFQEESQRRQGITPGYKLIEESGPDHKRHFVVGAYLEEDLIAKGEGSSKHTAEEHAAKNALIINKWQ